jgi:hypothetical protein
MMLGLSLPAFTTLHVVLSLIGIVTGILVVLGMLASQRQAGLTALFLASTVLTSVTGLMFPFAGFLPSHGFAILSLILLALALLALYAFHLAGSWRAVYIITAVASLYLNVFVGVVQAFQKQAFLQPLAPTQSEPPFLISQLVVLALAVLLAGLALRWFHPASRAAEGSP